jgi:two-component system sensor histidine kinase/response regulator
MTDSPSSFLPHSYDPFQVALSIVIAIAASYAALDLAGRVTATRRAVRAAWLGGGAISMGSGIWAMHFVGMLAFHLPVKVVYFWPTTLVTILLAVAASGVALSIVPLKGMGLRYALVSGCILGSGVAGLHYLGMTGMRMPAIYVLNPWIVVAAVAFGIVFATGGMWLGYGFRDETGCTVWKKLGGSLFMGAAVSSMHYTGMASASFRSSSAPVLDHTVYVSTLGSLGISAVILSLLGAAIAACFAGQQFDAQGDRLAVAEAKVELEHTTRLTRMGGLTASIAHEIKQPLTAIVTNANYSLRQLAASNPNLQEIRQAIREIEEDGNRASSIISRIRALLMKGSPQRTELHVNELTREVLNFLRSDIDENRIILNLDLAPELPPVFGDRIQLQQALMNVVVNSTEALRLVPEPRRQLTIRSRRSAEGLLIEVMDSGPGLDSQAAERLFEPFFTTKAEGMGLGLSISRSIIESHGGRLSNISKSYGATFEFIIPAASEISHE